MIKNRYLTKSKFKLAIECPRKLFYTGKEDLYRNKKFEDTFLAALADGGHQVGELAKYYFPGGHDIKTLDKKKALSKTNNLLKLENVIIYEAAICYKNLFIRADILVKTGNNIELIEVKSKSGNSKTFNSFWNKKKNEIVAEFKPYIQDVAFQKYVLSKAYPNFLTTSFLMLADKDATCSTDGLNQKFKLIKNENNYNNVEVCSSLNADDLADKILFKVNVDEYCDHIYKENNTTNNKSVSFESFVQFLADHYKRDEKISCKPSSICRKCEFKATRQDEKNGLKSGFLECWEESFGLNRAEIAKGIVLDIWNFKNTKKLIEERRVTLSRVTKNDISPKMNTKVGLSRSERQWLQVEKAQNNDKSVYIDKESIIHEINRWVYPLHFIDFETATVPIPFNKGQHPYETIAFQFSHHIVYKDGRIEHKGEFISREPGIFPNFNFIRALKKELENDNGTVFRYAPHENTVLNVIYNQLKQNSSDITDSEELCSFIKSITRSTGKSAEKWNGDRSMIDLCEIVKRFYYNPATKGSNSLKYVLPAILNSSSYLKEKYSKAIYGAKGGISSFNYKDWKWIKLDEKGRVIDPYKLLPKVFSDISEEDNESLLSDIKELNNGGIALTAYTRLQFTEMSDYERKAIETALLKYCELDTMAMVMLYEGLKKFVENN